MFDNVNLPWIFVAVATIAALSAIRLAATKPIAAPKQVKFKSKEKNYPSLVVAHKPALPVIIGGVESHEEDNGGAPGDDGNES